MVSAAVHVVALGARTPVGLSAESSAAAVRARISRIREHSVIVDMRGQPARVASDELLDPLLQGSERMLALARSALQEVVSKVEAPLGKLQGQFPIFLGLAEDRFGWNEQTARHLIHALGREASFGTEGWSVQPFRHGHASALEALRNAAQGVASGHIPLCVVGGVDTLVDADTLLWLDSRGRVAADGIRAGFPPGEGAGFLALASEAGRAALGLRSLGVVSSASSALETKLRGTNDVCLGEGLTKAIAQALAPLDPSMLIDEVYNDINGERYRTEEWGFALLRCQERLRSTTYTSAVGEWGDVGAASGALLTILALQAWQRGYARGNSSMICAGSDAGFRSAVVLERSG